MPRRSSTQDGLKTEEEEEERRQNKTTTIPVITVDKEVVSVGFNLVNVLLLVHADTSALHVARSLPRESVVELTSFDTPMKTMMPPPIKKKKKMVRAMSNIAQVALRGRIMLLLPW